MKSQHIKYCFFFVWFLCFPEWLLSQKIDLNRALDPVMAETKRQYPSLAKAGFFVDNFILDLQKESIQLFLCKSFEYIPYREEHVEALYDSIRSRLPAPLNKYDMKILVTSYPVEDLIPNFYLEKKKQDKLRLPPVLPENAPLVKNESRPYEITKGLENKHLAIWHSHGWYYDTEELKWQWQRPRLFQTIEDIYTMGYVLPFLTPMLENAGANVLLPRERDTQPNEVIVDNDDENAPFKEETGSGKEGWETGTSPGFSNSKAVYSELENPFSYGTCRQIKSRKSGDAFAEWTPNIPQRGEYAVYISYCSTRESVKDAHYTVFHSGGKTEFKVNQTMGGGTWIYLGTFHFDKGTNPATGKVKLTNESHENNKTVTADAVRFGGGMGNIGRTVTVEKDGQPATEVQTGGKARYLEGARYWLQWAGYPVNVYSPNNNHDYKDDYMCRGFWVNNLLGGSVKLPGKMGKNIPVDMSLAFHSDAGVLRKDSILGTMAIYMTDKGFFANGQRRLASRDLADLVQSEVVQEIQAAFRTNWTRRMLTDLSYHEVRVPEVPAMLLEILSHQNFTDMRYGLDPHFRFTVSRAVYKAILKFLASQYGVDYVVQPLPVTHFCIETMKKDAFFLSWRAQPDKREPSAIPQKYIVYTAVEDNGFDNGVVTNEPYIVIPVETGKIYRFKVAAVNEGGESFPSEILAACKMGDSQKTVLIINGFHRVAAPASFDNGLYAGFIDREDPGVPYRYDLSYTGSQYVFQKEIPFDTNEEPGYGASYGVYEDSVIAGNTFDFPYIHGKAIRNAGYSFVSCSDEIVMPENMRLNRYFAVDLILGKERETQTGKEKKYKIFKTPVRKVIEKYLNGGGNLFVSGAYIGSDIWERETCDPDEITFAENILHYRWYSSHASKSGKVSVSSNVFPAFKTKEYSFCNTPNSVQYAVEAPDAIEAVNDGYNILKYRDSQLPAGVAYKGSYRSVVAGFPFEAIKTEDEQAVFMKEIFNFFEK